LKFVPFKVSGLIPPDANFDGQVHTESCSSFKKAPPQVSSEADPFEIVDS